MDSEKLKQILRLHGMWLNGGNAGSRADLSRANLSGANLSRANLSGANLSGANLSGADLIEANLSEADLRWADLSRANLSEADLRWADLSRANLSEANLSRADLSRANLSGANLRWADLSRANLSGANLSGAKNILSSRDFLNKNFKKLANGLYVAYKANSPYHSSPETWKWEKGSILTEVVNPSRQDECGCGVNIATMQWIKSCDNCDNRDVWLVHFDPAGAIVPYASDGKIRVEWCQLIRCIKRGAK